MTLLNVNKIPSALVITALRVIIIVVFLFFQGSRSFLYKYILAHIDCFGNSKVMVSRETLKKDSKLPNPMFHVKHMCDIISSN